MECREVYSLTWGILLPGDSVISLSLSLSLSLSFLQFQFQFQFQCPPLASQLNNIGRASKSLSLFPSSPLASSCPSPSSWYIFTFLKIYFQCKKKHRKHLSYMATLQLQVEFSIPFYLSCFSLDNHALKSLRLTLYSFCLIQFFYLNVLTSRWIPYSVTQQVCGGYASSGPASPPRHTEGNLHRLNPDSFTSPTLIHHQDPPSSWLLPPPEFIITCTSDIALLLVRNQLQSLRVMLLIWSIWGISVSSVMNLSQRKSQQFVLCVRHKLLIWARTEGMQSVMQLINLVKQCFCHHDIKMSHTCLTLLTTYILRGSLWEFKLKTSTDWGGAAVLTLWCPPMYFLSGLPAEVSMLNS